jgi:hypothetical protein
VEFGVVIVRGDEDADTVVFFEWAIVAQKYRSIRHQRNAFHDESALC